MKSRNIKVVDEHNIDRDANIIFGLDLEGSEYVVYWIERDEESNNVFVSKVVKNLDNTFNLANIEEEFEKESVSKIVKDLIAKAVSDEADKLVGETFTLEDGKTVKFISVSFNKEQRMDVKKTYITTVKKEVTRVSEKYYDVVVSIEEPQLVEVLPENTQDIFPEIVASEPEKVEEVPTVVSEPVAPVIPEVAVAPAVPEVSEPAIAISEETPKEESLNDEFVAFGVEEKAPEPVVTPVEVASQEPVGAVVESITNESVLEPAPVLETPTVEVKTEEVPVLEAPVVEKSEPVVVPTEVSTQTTPVVEEPRVVLPEPIVPTPVVPVIPEPVTTSVTPEVSEPVAAVATPAPENQPLVFNASKETNLNAALGEVAKDTTIPVENIDVVREFGEESPVLPQTPVTPAQPAIAPMVQPEVASEAKALTKKAGFANSKFFMVVAIAFFLASCVFLGYEVFNYFQLTK